MTALPLRNEWDWPNMGELDAYVDARSAWEKQAGRLSELITLLGQFAKALENGPPFRVPAQWPDRTALQAQMDATATAWNEMAAKWNAIPVDRKSYATPLPTRAGYRAPIAQ